MKKIACPPDAQPRGSAQAAPLPYYRLRVSIIRDKNSHMIRGNKIGVVVPAFNEERFISGVLATMPGFVDRIFVVDDASTDATLDVALRVKDGRIVIIEHRRNMGVGASIVTGYRAAVSNGMHVVAVMAGDGQMDPDDLEKIVTPLIERQADYSKGDRLSWPGALGEMPFPRFVGNHFFSAMSRAFCGYSELKDSQCGYTAVTASCLSRLDLDDLYPGYGFPNDMLSKLSRVNARLAQIPVRPVYGREKSGINLFTALVRMPGVILVCGMKRRKRVMKDTESPTEEAVSVFPADHL